MKQIIARFFALVIGLAGADATDAQPYTVPLHQGRQAEVERQLPDSLNLPFTSVRGWQAQWLPENLQYPRDTTRRLNRWMNGHLIRYYDEQEKVGMWIDPVVSLTGGAYGDGGTYLFSRGAQAGLHLGRQLAIGVSFTENQGRFPNFLNDFSENNNLILPGVGKVRRFKEDGWDWALSEGYLRYAPAKVFSATLGYGQNFLGEGYRSLFLSDNAFNYPYLQLNLNLKKLHYTVLYNQYQNINDRLADRYARKFSTLHYLTVSLGKRWQVGVFDGVVWQAEDTAGERGFDFAYLNPIPFLRPIEFSRGSPDNMMMGLHGSFKAFPRTMVYTQLLLDDINFQATRDSGKQHLNNKYAIQAGIKHHGQWKELGYSLRAEYNYARPYTYGHRKPQQSITHYNQPLAHPLGANFHEGILQGFGNYKRWYAEATLQYALVGREDPNTPYNDGNDLFGGEAGVPLFGSTTLQGNRTRQFTGGATVGWLLNTRWNLGVQGSFWLRRVNPDIGSKERTTWIQLGLVTRLRNMYLDF